MELKEPRPKKPGGKSDWASHPLPVVKTAEGENHKFHGRFNGFSVLVEKLDEMVQLSQMGCFGKGSLSRGFPSFNPSGCESEIIRKRVFEQRKKFAAVGVAPKKVIVVPDSESDTEDYFTNLRPEYQIDKSALKETVSLALEEAYFLFSRVTCLNIYDGDELLSEQQAWELFREADRYFTQNYPVYCHFRAKNWVVKPGIKFGGDFLLYKEGPLFYHASYVVIIDVLSDKTLERRTDMCRRPMEMQSLLGLNRLCETVGKELLVCQLFWPDKLEDREPQCIEQLSINETLMRRWVPSQQRKQQ